MPRQHPIPAAVPPIAVRRAEAAASLGISVETFDLHVRPSLPALHIGGVTVYAVTDLAAFAARHADPAPAAQLATSRATRRSKPLPTSDPGAPTQ